MALKIPNPPHQANRRPFWIWWISAFTFMATSVLCSRLSEAAGLTCQMDPSCQQLQEQGIKAHNQMRYAEAVELYQQAFARVADPRLLVLMGRSKFKMGDAAEALSFYNRALPTITDADERVPLDRFIAEAQTRLPASASKPSRQAPEVAPLLPSRMTLTEPKAVYKKWWLWTVVGTAAAGTAVAIALGVLARGPDTTGVPEYQWFSQ